jgi:hypothetical protein
MKNMRFGVQKLSLIALAPMLRATAKKSGKSAGLRIG